MSQNVKKTDNKKGKSTSKTVPLSSAEYTQIKKKVANKEQSNKRKVPETAQNSIPFDKITEDGIAICSQPEERSIVKSLFSFALGKQENSKKRYSKTVQFYDVDYTIADISKQQNIFLKYCDLLNTFDNSVKFQISVANVTSDDDFDEIIQIPDKDDDFNDIRHEYADMLKTQLAKGNNGFIRVNYITFSIKDKNIANARRKLVGIEKDIVGYFGSFGVAAIPLNAGERLFAMYKLMHQYSSEPFLFENNDMAHSGMSAKDYIAPSSLNFQKNAFMCGKYYGTTYALNVIASDLSDRVLTDILNSENPISFNMHYTAIDTIEAKKYVKKKLSDVEKMKIDEQKKAAQQGYDMDILPPDIKTYIKEIDNLLDNMESKNERMFFVTILITNFAKSKKELDGYHDRLNRVVLKHNSKLIPLDYIQDLAFASVLPLCENRIDIERRYTTTSSAAFLPFSTKEVFMDGESIYYGLNPISNNMLLADRKQFKNPNGIILGTPGAGKSFTVKREISNVFLVTDDDIVISDPEDEYFPLVEALHGQIVEISTSSVNYINPMDIVLNSEDEDVIGVKSEFLLSLCELIVGGKYGLDSEEISIVDRCIRSLYLNYMENNPTEDNMPILGDLQEALIETGEEAAKRVANSLEIYVTGSLNIFNHRTNVDLNNRIICFNLKKLGNNLRKLGMLIVQDQVWNKVSRNKKQKSTRYYMDEFHLLLKEPQTAKYSVDMWKRFRKYGGIPTGITQNVKDFLSANATEVEAIFENSDFVIMLNQAAGDKEILSERLKISKEQQKYITNAKQGQGLIFFEGNILPFVDEFPRDTKLYKLMTTKPKETLI